MTNSDFLEATKRFVAWRINNYDTSCPSIKSKEFMMGKWYWHLEFRPSEKRIILIQNEKPSSTQGLPVPIVSFVFRMLHHIRGIPCIGAVEVTDHLCNSGFVVVGERKGHRGIPLTFSFEFLDLKVTHENDGKSYSIWDEEYTERNPSNEPLSRMLSESIYPDVVINTIDGSIEAHRAVLAVSSPVFRTMFSKNYKEKETSTINITDMSTETCKAMVNFIYGRRRNEIRAHMIELMVAADKYDITELKMVCEANLCDDVGAKNVFEKLKCASMFGLQDLKSTCLFYLVKMGTIFELQDDYNSFLREADRELIVDISNAYFYPGMIKDEIEESDMHD